MCEGAVDTSVEGYLLSQPAQPGIIFLDHICEADLSDLHCFDPDPDADPYSVFAIALMVEFLHFIFLLKEK